MASILQSAWKVLAEQTTVLPSILRGQLAFVRQQPG